MTKAELVRLVAEKAEVTQKVAAKVLDAALEAVREAAARGEKVALPGFGAFVVVERKARTVKSPKGNVVDLPARKLVKFRAGKVLRDAVK
ncbi:MAG: HU family DNA-binding protein [Firmicutes bacterium]|nr:HU family DNA-binding protein [Bacillota bacterium]